MEGESEASVIVEEQNEMVEESDSMKFKPKRLKASEESETLEERLNEILCCAVCLGLPKSAIYQCRNGHLMCAECFNHLLADAHLRLSTTTSCPSCRTQISRDLCVRNLVVEKAVSEMPLMCPNCSIKYPRCLKQVHEKQVCLERTVSCIYFRIGCPWAGPFKKKTEHEKRCAQPNKTGNEIKDSISDIYLPIEPAERSYFCDYLSFENISYSDLNLLGPYQSDEYLIRFETFRFCAFGKEWEIRAHVNNNEADPTLSSERSLSYQLLLKESVDGSIFMHYAIVKGPLSEIKLRPHVEEFLFSNSTPSSHFALLPLEDSLECYRLLSGIIRFRVIMFWDECT